MAFNWNKFPWTNLHELNLDWIIQKVKQLENKVAELGVTVANAVQEFTTKLPATVQDAITEALTGSGDLTINKTGDVRISGNSVQLTKGAVVSDGSEQLTMHNPASNTSMTANYNSGVLTLTNNQDLAAGVALYPIRTPEIVDGDDSDFAANVGYVKTAVEAVDGKLDTEITNRTSGDAALQSTIDSVIMPRLNKIPTKTSELINDSGFGTYSKPAGGIPESDLSLDVKTKLNNVSAVESVNGRTGAVVLNAEDVGAQRPLIPGSGISIVWSEDGDIIQSDAVGGSGTVSFVDVAGGAPIAEFTLNQTQDCEINVNDLNASLSTKVNNLETSLSNNYRTAAAQDVIDAQKQSIITDLETIRSGAAKGATALQSVPTTYRTAAEQDVIDNTKLTDAPTDGKEYARKNGNWHEITGAVESVNGKTGVVTLNATEIPSTKLSPADTISFLIDGAFDEGLVELKRNGAPASANDFISAVNSGSPVTVGLNDQGNPKVTFDERPVKYKITNDTLSLCFIAEIGHQYTPAIYVLSGTISGTAVSVLVEHRFTDSLYQENYVSANDLPVSAPMSVEEYLEALTDFVINGTINSNMEVTLDKTFAQIQAAIQDGKHPVVYIAGMGDDFLPLVCSSTDYITFAAVSDVSEGTISSTGITITNDDTNIFNFSACPTLDSEGFMNQYPMEADPVSPMQIATKKYVDNKECILKSTTPGSTKKFKITVDDSGNISATEVI